MSVAATVMASLGAVSTDAGLLCVNRGGDVAGLLVKIRNGTATAADLAFAGATQLGAGSDNFAPCTADGRSCADVFAMSLPGVTRSRFLNWFSALEACGNSGKRLPGNAEWQKAVVGTPGPGSDNGTPSRNTTAPPVDTGARSACVSSAGAFDMVGNPRGWVATLILALPAVDRLASPGRQLLRASRALQAILGNDLDHRSEVHRPCRLRHFWRPLALHLMN